MCRRMIVDFVRMDTHHKTIQGIQGVAMDQFVIDDNPSLLVKVESDSSLAL